MIFFSWITSRVSPAYCTGARLTILLQVTARSSSQYAPKKFLVVLNLEFHPRFISEFPLRKVEKNYGRKPRINVRINLEKNSRKSHGDTPVKIQKYLRICPERKLPIITSIIFSETPFGIFPRILGEIDSGFFFFKILLVGIL